MKKMGVDLNVYRARIGGFMNMKIKKKGEIKGGTNTVVWFMFLVIAVLLLRGGGGSKPWTRR